MSWSVLFAWTAMPLLVWSILTLSCALSRLCPTSCLSRQFRCSHSYCNSLSCILLPSLSPCQVYSWLRWVRRLCSVLFTVNTILMSRFPHYFSMLSLRPRTHGIIIIIIALQLAAEGQRSVWVGFLYTNVVRPLCPLWTSTSRKGSFPSCSVSMVNSMLGARELRCMVGQIVVERIAAMWPDDDGVIHIVEPEGAGWSAVSMAMVLKDSMYRSPLIDSSFSLS